MSAITGENMLIEVVTFLSWAILWYFIFLSLGYIVLLIVAIPEVYFRFYEKEKGHIDQIVYPNLILPVTIIICAYNEENSIIDTVYSVLKSDYTDKHILIVNDGSTDNTLKKLEEVFDLQPTTLVVPDLLKTKSQRQKYYSSKYHINFTVIDKENTGKSDSLNVALNTCRTHLFITLDADTLLEPDAIKNIMFYKMTHAHVVAVGGAVYVLNGCEYKNGKVTNKKLSLQPIYAIQSCEYMRSFIFNRSGWNFFGGALSFAGAFSFFDRKAVIDMGGFDNDNLAQDFEVVTHLHAYQREHKQFYTVGYNASAIAWTDVPGTLKDFWRQRFIWQKDTLRSLLLHKKMFLNIRYGIVGLFTYPFYLLGETLAPIVEFTAYILVFISWYLGILDIYLTVLLVLICWGFATFITMVTALINILTYNIYGGLKNIFWYLLIVSTESLGFRQFVVICRVSATVKYFLNKLKFW